MARRSGATQSFVTVELDGVLVRPPLKLTMYASSVKDAVQQLRNIRPNLEVKSASVKVAGERYVGLSTSQWSDALPKDVRAVSFAVDVKKSVKVKKNEKNSADVNKNEKKRKAATKTAEETPAKKLRRTDSKPDEKEEGEIEPENEKKEDEEQEEDDSEEEEEDEEKKEEQEEDDSDEEEEEEDDEEEKKEEGEEEQTKKQEEEKEEEKAEQKKDTGESVNAPGVSGPENSETTAQARVLEVRGDIEEHASKAFALANGLTPASLPAAVENSIREAYEARSAPNESTTETPADTQDAMQTDAPATADARPDDEPTAGDTQPSETTAAAEPATEPAAQDTTEAAAAPATERPAPVRAPSFIGSRPVSMLQRMLASRR